MQPRSDVKLDEKSFQILKNTMKSISNANRKRGENATYATKLPESVAIKLTNRCNLRCAHCYQWNESGYHRFMDKEQQNADIDFKLIKKVFDETKQTKSRLYLWGGEPLIYGKFDQIADLLEKDQRETIICTNGILINEHLKSILKISSNLELLIAIEGFEKEHDAIRGKGSFCKTMNAIDQLIELRKSGEFKGKITIHTMINEAMIPKLFDLMDFFEKKEVDMVFLCFPWYICHDLSVEMDEYYADNFQWLKANECDQKHSWYAFKYKLSTQCLETLTKALERINQRMWHIRIRYQPGLELDEIEDFISGKKMTGQGIKQCLALSNRMDITPDGRVSACKLFSEFSVGNIEDNSLLEVWHGENFQKVREIINSQGLMPVCSKCNVLYLNSH